MTSSTIDSTNEYVLIAKNRLWLHEQEQGLSMQELQRVIENRDIITKRLRNSITNYRVALSIGKFKGKEEMLYRSVDTLEEVINSLGEAHKPLQEYLKKIAEQEAEIERKKNEGK